MGNEAEGTTRDETANAVIPPLVPFRVIVADPPWQFGDLLPGPTRGAGMNYQTLPLYEIRKLESFLPKVLIAHDCALFLWRVSSMVEEAYSVCRDWGFAPKTELVWIKKTKYGLSHFGMGRYLRAAHETCIVAIRGSWKPQHLSQRTIFEAQTGRHSEKPDEFYKLVVDLTAGPRAELFARRQRDGFFSFGNEVENVVC